MPHDLPLLGEPAQVEQAITCLKKAIRDDRQPEEQPRVEVEIDAG